MIPPYFLPQQFISSEWLRPEIGRSSNREDWRRCDSPFFCVSSVIYFRHPVY